MDTNKIGDCFEENGKAFLFRLSQGKLPEDELPDEIKTVMSKIKRWKLVHANLIYQKDNKPFSHCWVEGDNLFAFDLTSGAHPSMLANYRDEFYNISRIPASKYPKDWKGLEDQTYLFKYDVKDVKAVLAKLGENMHWGPWDFECVR